MPTSALVSLIRFSVGAGAYIGPRVVHLLLIIFIRRPFAWIIVNIFPFDQIIPLVPDHMIVKRPLPNAFPNLLGINIFQLRIFCEIVSSG